MKKETATTKRRKDIFNVVLANIRRQSQLRMKIGAERPNLQWLDFDLFNDLDPMLIALPRLRKLRDSIEYLITEPFLKTYGNL